MHFPAPLAFFCQFLQKKLFADQHIFDGDDLQLFCAGMKSRRVEMSAQGGKGSERYGPLDADCPENDLADPETLHPGKGGLFQGAAQFLLDVT